MSGHLSYQKRVVNWLMACFSMEVCRDDRERNHRFLEEALELVQALKCTRSEAHQLVDYVFDRPVGEPKQELGGTLLTLTALANCHDMDLQEAGEAELARVWTKIDRIREKQAAKPAHSPLPQHVDVAQASWQPIETAPKDGTAVVLGFWYQGRFAQYQGFWTTAGWMENSKTYFPSHMQKWFEVWTKPPAPPTSPLPSTNHSPPAATVGDIPSEPRPPASAAMGHSAGGGVCHDHPTKRCTPQNCVCPVSSTDRATPGE